jgi:hypothetical protein
MEIAIALGAVVVVCGGVLAIVFRRIQDRNKTG